MGVGWWGVEGLRILNVKCSRNTQILTDPCYVLMSFHDSFSINKTMCHAVGSQHCFSKASSTGI